MGGLITLLGRVMARIGDAKSRAAVGPKTRELKGGVQSLMGLMRLIVRNAEKRWSLDLVSSAISTAARIIRNAPAPLTPAGPAHEILQILRAGKTRPGGGLQTASDLRKTPYAKCRVRLAYIRQLRRHDAYVIGRRRAQSRDGPRSLRP